jgi:hypothetical protein
MSGIGARFSSIEVSYVVLTVAAASRLVGAAANIARPVAYVRQRTDDRTRKRETIHREKGSERFGHSEGIIISHRGTG